jgi:hypothetical protein
VRRACLPRIMRAEAAVDAEPGGLHACPVSIR